MVSVIILLENRKMEKERLLAEKIRKQASRIAYNTNSHKTENKVNQDQYTIDDNLW